MSLSEYLLKYVGQNWPEFWHGYLFFPEFNSSSEWSQYGSHTKRYDMVYFFFSSYEYLQSNQKSQQYLGNKMHSPI